MNYRQIWEKHFGSIPIDENGISYDIHHIDGNRDNNSPKNLKCVSMKEHFDIHWNQQDYGACYYIAKRMLASKHTLSKLSKQVQADRVTKGTHNFLADKNPIHQLVKNKKLIFQQKNYWDTVGRQKARENNIKRIKENNHNWFNINPWEHSHVSEKTRKYWGQANKYYSFWKKTQCGYRKLGKHFNIPIEEYSFQIMVDKFKKGWIPDNDDKWKQFFNPSMAKRV